MTSIGDAEKSWLNFLNPDILRTSLIEIAVYIAAFEMFKDRVMGLPEIFFSDGFNESGPIISEQYYREVLTRRGSKFQASLVWLAKLGAIDQNDIKSIDEIRKHRNEITHEMVLYLGSDLNKLDQRLFANLVFLIDKIERWWLLNVEASTNPDLLSGEVDIENIFPLSSLTLRLLLDISLGNEPEPGYYYKELKKLLTQRQQPV